MARDRPRPRDGAAVWWIRRDLRLAGNPALCAAADAADHVLALFVLDARLRRPAGANRLAFLYRALRDLDRRLGGRLVVRSGDPAEVVGQVAAEAAASRVYCAADFGPYGRCRDEQVEAALAKRGLALRRVGSPYALAPGMVLKADGTPYTVFTPFLRTWRELVAPEPLPEPEVAWVKLATEAVPDDPPVTAALPDATEAAAQRRLEEFASAGVRGYAQDRDRPGVEGPRGCRRT